MLLLSILVTLSSLVTCDNRPSRPNILYILADDVGFGDVSWNNPRMVTPVLHKLASQARVMKMYNETYKKNKKGTFLSLVKSYFLLTPDARE